MADTGLKWKGGLKFVGFGATYFDPERLVAFRVHSIHQKKHVELWLDGAATSIELEVPHTNDFLAFARDRGLIAKEEA